MLSNVVVDQYADMIAGLLLHDPGVKLGYFSQTVKYVHQISKCDLITQMYVYMINKKSGNVTQEDGMISQ